MMFPDPMFQKLIEVCNKSESIADRAQRMVDAGSLIETTARGLTITWHLSDAALDLIYEAEGAG